jgi:DNA processing protein
MLVSAAPAAPRAPRLPSAPPVPPALPHIETIQSLGLRRPLFSSGEASLLERPLVAVVGAKCLSPATAGIARRMARALVRAGFVVASQAQSRGGRLTLAAAITAGGAVVGMLDAPFPASFVPPLQAPAGRALWLSIFERSRYLLSEGPDAGDRALGAIVAAVVVTDTGGLPDAFYVAEAALAAGRPVFFPRHAAPFWPGSMARPGVRVGCSPAGILKALAPLLP